MARHSKIALTAICIVATTLCVVVMLTSCASTRREIQPSPPNDKMLEIRQDSTDFIPLHPPVVIPKNWRETMTEM